MDWVFIRRGWAQNLYELGFRFGAALGNRAPRPGMPCLERGWWPPRSAGRALPGHALPVSGAPQLGRLTSMTRSAPRPARKLLPAARDLAALAVAPWPEPTSRDAPAGRPVAGFHGRAVPSPEALAS